MWIKNFYHCQGRTQADRVRIKWAIQPETLGGVDIVHDGVDCTLFCPSDGTNLRKEVSPWAEHVCIIHGVIDPQDGPEVLVDAAVSSSVIMFIVVFAGVFSWVVATLGLTERIASSIIELSPMRAPDRIAGDR